MTMSRKILTSLGNFGLSKIQAAGGKAKPVAVGFGFLVMTLQGPRSVASPEGLTTFRINVYSVP